MREEDHDTAEESGDAGGAFSEDWLATLVGLAILLLALAGLIPAGWLW